MHCLFLALLPWQGCSAVNFRFLCDGREQSKIAWGEDCQTKAFPPLNAAPPGAQRQRQLTLNSDAQHKGCFRIYSLPWLPSACNLRAEGLSISVKALLSGSLSCSSFPRILGGSQVHTFARAVPASWAALLPSASLPGLLGLIISSSSVTRPPSHLSHPSPNLGQNPFLPAPATPLSKALLWSPILFFSV